MKKIYHHTIDAATSLIKLLESSGTIDTMMDSILDIRLPYELEPIMKLVDISVPRISLLNLLQGNELPTIVDIYHAYRYSGDLTPSHLTSHPRCSYLIL